MKKKGEPKKDDSKASRSLNEENDPTTSPRRFWAGIKYYSCFDAAITTSHRRLTFDKRRWEKKHSDGGGHSNAMEHPFATLVDILKRKNSKKFQKK